MKSRTLLLGCTAVATLLGACASKPPADTKIVAPEKEFKAQGVAQPWKIGGVFDKKDKTVTISVNGDNVMKANFPPYTPRLSANGKYQNQALATSCSFSTDVISGSGRGRTGIAQSIVQKSTGNTANTCDVTVNGQQAVTLYF
jgi:hypothetical protein